MIAFNKFGHLVIGSLLCFLFGQSFLEYFCILFGSLLPDIDNRFSTLGRLNPFAFLMNHRGKCHTLIGAAVLSLPAALLNLSAYLCVLVGCVGHIFGDKLRSLFGGRSFRIRLW